MDLKDHRTGRKLKSSRVLYLVIISEKLFPLLPILSLYYIGLLCSSFILVFVPFKNPTATSYYRKQIKRLLFSRPFETLCQGWGLADASSSSLLHQYIIIMLTIILLQDLFLWQAIWMTRLTTCSHTGLDYRPFSLLCMIRIEWANNVRLHFSPCIDTHSE